MRRLTEDERSLLIRVLEDWLGEGFEPDDSAESLAVKRLLRTTPTPPAPSAASAASTGSGIQSATTRTGNATT